jgi:hypothetical protein
VHDLLVALQRIVEQRAATLVAVELRAEHRFGGAVLIACLPETSHPLTVNPLVWLTRSAITEHPNSPRPIGVDVTGAARPA